MSFYLTKIYLFISSFIFLFVVTFYLNTTVSGLQMFYEFYIFDNCILVGLESISLVFIFLTLMMLLSKIVCNLLKRLHIFLVEYHPLYNMRLLFLFIITYFLKY